MTNEEAKNVLLSLKTILTSDHAVVPYSDNDIVKAVDLAVTALERASMTDKFDVVELNMAIKERKKDANN